MRKQVVSADFSINGYGRICQSILRALYSQQQGDLQVFAIQSTDRSRNPDLPDPLRNDTPHRRIECLHLRVPTINASLMDPSIHVKQKPAKLFRTAPSPLKAACLT